MKLLKKGSPSFRSKKKKSTTTVRKESSIHETTPQPHYEDSPDRRKFTSDDFEEIKEEIIADVEEKMTALVKHILQRHGKYPEESSEDSAY